MLAPTTNLQVLIADERQERLDAISRLIAASGHTVIARLVDVSSAGAEVREARPDLAIVAVGANPVHALELVEEIVDEAVCAVIVHLDAADPEFTADAARVGVFGHLIDADPEELQGAIEIALRRFAEFDGLRRAFARRAVIEQAKGVLMERHALGPDEAFAQLRSTARSERMSVFALAGLVLSGRTLDGL